MWIAPLPKKKRETVVVNMINPMKSISVIPGDQHVEIVDIEKPEPTGKEVLVKVKLVGLDGTDKEIFRGSHGEPPPGEQRLIIGHEAVGEVVEVGGSVKSFAPGDLVVATVRRPDDCLNCQAGEYDMCFKGAYTERGIKGRDGFLSEYYLEEERFLVNVPEEIGELGVLLEPVSIAEKAIRTVYSVQKRMIWQPETALIAGTGGLGLLTAMLVRLRDLEVISVDRSDDEYKEDIFSELGVQHFNTQKINLHDIPKAIGKQIDIIFEETGSSSVALHSMSVVGTNGVVVLLSITGDEKKIKICSSCLNRGLVLGNKTVVGSVSSHIRDFKRGIKDLQRIKKRWPGLLEKIITARFPPENIQKALYSLDDEIKTVIDFSQ